MVKKERKTGFMKGVAVLMLSQVIIKLVGLIYKLYLTNKEGFGDRGNAIYGSAFQIYAILLTFSSIGVPNAISKLISSKVAIGDNKGAYRIFKVAIAIFGVLGFIGSAIMFFGAKYIANVYLQIPEAELTIIALAPSVFLVSIESVLKGYFNGRENISVTAGSQNFEQVFKAIFTIAIVEQIASISSKNTILMAAGATLATTLASLSSVGYLYKYFVKRKKEVWQEVVSSKVYKNEGIRKIIKNILMVSVPIALCGLFSVVGKTIDAFTIVRVLKSSIGEEMATIQYGILNGKVDTLVNLPFSFNIALSTALVPTIAAAIAQKKFGLAKKRIEFSILITILIGLPCTICMSLFSRQILELLFPNASLGAEMLQLASLTIIFVVLIQTVNGALQGLGKLRIPVIAFAIGALVKLFFNLILLPQIGIQGAIVASILSHIISLIICFISLNKYMSLRLSINKFIIKPIIASIIMAISSYLFYIKMKSVISLKILLIVSLLIGTLIYFILLFMLKIFSKGEIYMIPYGNKLYKQITKKQ